MAGTPTANYNFPTYADTDVPDLTGAYNQAVNAIDAKIKEVADTIPSGADVPDATSTTKGIAKLYDSTTVGAGDQDDGGITPKAVDDKIGGSLTGYAHKFTVAAPITYSDNQIGVSLAKVNDDGTSSGAGTVNVSGKQSDISSAVLAATRTVPNVKAVKDYVDAKVPTEQQAYTGNAPILVDNSQRTISVASAKIDSETHQQQTAGVVRVTGNATTINTGNDIMEVIVPNRRAVADYVESKLDAAGVEYTGTAPIVVDNGSRTISVNMASRATVADDVASPGRAGVCYVVNTMDAYYWVINHAKDVEKPENWATLINAPVGVGVLMNMTPDATTSVKGLVQLTNTFNASNETNAATPKCVDNALTVIPTRWPTLQSAATTPLTTEMLANLYVTPSGMVVYKAPTE